MKKILVLFLLVLVLLLSFVKLNQAKNLVYGLSYNTVEKSIPERHTPDTQIVNLARNLLSLDQKPSGANIKVEFVQEEIIYVEPTPAPTSIPTPQPAKNENNEASSVYKDSGYTGEGNFDPTKFERMFPNGVPQIPQETANKFRPPASFLLDLYGQMEEMSGISAAIFAGIHFQEGSNRTAASFVNGYTVGSPDPQYNITYNSIEETMGPAINFLSQKLGKCGYNGDPASIDESMISCALSYYNGGGNKNCPHFSDLPFCPAPYVGYDDPYVYNGFDQVHEKMYLIYCADYTTCVEYQGYYPERDKPGTLSYAVWFYWTYINP